MLMLSKKPGHILAFIPVCSGNMVPNPDAAFGASNERNVTRPTGIIIYISGEREETYPVMKREGRETIAAGVLGWTQWLVGAGLGENHTLRRQQV